MMTLKKQRIFRTQNNNLGTDMKKYIFLTIFCLFFYLTNSLAEEKLLFSCLTEKHSIDISQLDNNTVRYRSWNKPKSKGEKPDMNLISVVDPSNKNCPSYWKFKTGKTEFEVSDQWSCRSPSELIGKEPSNATGDIWIKTNGDLKAHFYCTK